MSYAATVWQALESAFTVRSFVVQHTELMTLNAFTEDIHLAEQLEQHIQKATDLELCVPRRLALCVFRLAPEGQSLEQCNALNRALASRLDARKDLFLTPSVLPGGVSVSGCTCSKSTGLMLRWRSTVYP